MSTFVMITKLIIHEFLKILTRFITLTGGDPVYASETYERTSHYVKPAQHHHRFQAY